MKEVNLEKLKELRKANNYTMKQISKELGICESYYCQIETGKRNLYYAMAKKIAKVFNLKPDDIFYE